MKHYKEGIESEGPLPAHLLGMLRVLLTAERHKDIQPSISAILYVKFTHREDMIE